MSSIPGLGRSPRVGNGNLLQYSYLENSMDREAWWAALHGQEESDTTKLASLHIYTYISLHLYIYIHTYIYTLSLHIYIHIYMCMYMHIYSKKIKTFIFCFINM